MNKTFRITSKSDFPDLNNLKENFPELTSTVEGTGLILVCWNGDSICRVATGFGGYKIIPIGSGDNLGTKYQEEGQTIMAILKLISTTIDCENKMKRPFSDAEIRDKYLADLKLAAVAARYKEEPDKPSWFEEWLEAGEIEWSCSNGFVFYWPEGYGLMTRDLEFFQRSDVCWSMAMVCLRNNRLAVEILLVDWYEDTPNG